VSRPAKVVSAAWRDMAFSGEVCESLVLSNFDAMAHLMPEMTKRKAVAIHRMLRLLIFKVSLRMFASSALVAFSHRNAISKSE
jgi:hypothetical protein